MKDMLRYPNERNDPEAMATPPEATADPIQSPVATDPTATMALLTAATTTESRQHQRNNLILVNMN